MNYDGVLICSAGDRSLARWIAEELRKYGVSIWWEGDASFAYSWSRRRLTQIMLSSRHVVLLWSPHSRRSRYVHAELELAQEMGVPIVVCMVGEAPRLPTWFADKVVNAVAFEPVGDNAALVRLAHVLQTSALEMEVGAEPRMMHRSQAYWPMLVAAAMLGFAAIQALAITLRSAGGSGGKLMSMIGSAFLTMRELLSVVASRVLDAATAALLPVIAFSLLLSLTRSALEYVAAWRVTRRLGPPPASEE